MLYTVDLIELATCPNYDILTVLHVLYHIWSLLEGWNLLSVPLTHLPARWLSIILTFHTGVWNPYESQQYAVFSTFLFKYWLAPCCFTTVFGWKPVFYSIASWALRVTHEEPVNLRSRLDWLIKGGLREGHIPIGKYVLCERLCKEILHTSGPQNYTKLKTLGQ